MTRFGLRKGSDPFDHSVTELLGELIAVGIAFERKLAAGGRVDHFDDLIPADPLLKSLANAHIRKGVVGDETAERREIF